MSEVNVDQKQESDLDDEKTLQIALGQFFQATDRIKKSNVSTKGLLRSIQFAFHKGLTTRAEDVKLKSDGERQVAMLLGIMLDARLILLGRAYKNEQKRKQEQEQGDNDERSATDS